ncbi:MAG: hypothetical protein DRG24_03095 [Epsilonproteobacteria bacterium]|nr:MAG: hypothetical protein DRG24_03095 [Campylobacterota bacterium]
MKLLKMSLAAAMLMGASAFAIENVKVDGDAKLYYGTDDHDYNTEKDDQGNDMQVKNDNAGLFHQSTSYGEASLRLGVTADLTTGVSAGVTMYGISTLGLDNNLVSATFTGGTKNNFWFGEAWLAGTAGNTTGKVGRMMLDTPLVFSETWSVAPNTFEAGVILNQDIPDTTLVAAYVGESNGAAVLGGGLDNEAGDDAQSDIYDSFYNGAYAFGAINNSWKPLTVQAWYFDAQQAVKAYWLEADLSMSGIVAGAIYTNNDYGDNIDADFGLALDGKDSDAYALKLGFEGSSFAVSAAYSQTGNDAPAGFNLDGAQSKLYTEAWWNYGYITQADTMAYNVTATYSIADIADLGAYYTDADQDSAAGNNDLTELTLEVARSFGPLDAGLYYIFTDAEDQNVDAAGKSDSYNAVQVYLTYNF